MKTTHYKRGKDGRPCTETAALGALCDRIGMTEYAVKIALVGLNMKALDAWVDYGLGRLSHYDIIEAYMAAE